MCETERVNDNVLVCLEDQVFLHMYITPSREIFSRVKGLSTIVFAKLDV